MTDADRSGLLFVLSAPSGAGKTSLRNALVADTPGLIASVSHTTRPRRDGEQEGIAYHFMPTDAFAAMVEAGVFLEHAEVFGNRYGTSRTWVEQRLAEGTDVLLEIDWQGARQIRAALPGCISIFVLPPSRGALRERLVGRGSDARATIERRLAEAERDISHWHEYDYVVVNDDFHRALGDLQAIVRACRLKSAQQGVRHRTLIGDLLR